MLVVSRFRVPDDEAEAFRTDLERAASVLAERPGHLSGRIGRNVDEAKTVLQNMGLFVTVEERQSDKPKGQVIEQSPNDGAGVEPGATITLVVSSGPPQVQVPDVTSTHSLPCAEADAALRGAGLTPKLLGNPAGIAVAQQPPPGTMVDPGAEVNIWCQ